MPRSKNSPRTLVLIPARLASTRLPGKPLVEIGGLPMIVQVIRRAEAAKLGEVWVATDDLAIQAAVEKAGGNAIMTRKDHVSGSDRIFEALRAIDPKKKVKIVVNVQGDLPTVEPATIRAAAKLVQDRAVDIGTVAAVIDNENDRVSPNVVKVIGSAAGKNRLRALYFTRATAPSGEGPLYHHIGLYAYRRAALEKFVKLKPSGLEQREKLEQ
ncbi:MAG TPA: 3-deoxy-manno-octulosonate cytidylyltransferase, partial [Xanthobacteraceae bacterium]|nr:3-deoxy-manno-octulosonate cytidylyltransferase [Xanthobacteraceae bacterium]